MRIVIEQSELTGELSVKATPPAPERVLAVLNQVLEATRQELAVREALRRMTGGLVVPAPPAPATS
jgi:hypothetical protein